MERNFTIKTIDRGYHALTYPLYEIEELVLTRRDLVYAATASLTVMLSGCNRKPVGPPMPTDGPNQYVFAVPEMT